MVAFAFNALTVTPWPGAKHDSPLETAVRLWYSCEDDLSFKEVCNLAAFDREVYDALWGWAVANKSVLAEGYKIPLFEALVCRPPRKGKWHTAQRDARLRWVAARLLDKYPNMRTTPGAAGKGPSPEAILAQLRIDGMPSEKGIRNILGKNPA